MFPRLMCAAALAGFSLAAAPPAAAQGGNPYDGDRGAIRAGAALYANRCAECHGADAKGLNGPDLTALWLSVPSEARIFRTIRQGVTGSVMPSSTAPDEEIWATIAYLKSVSTVPTVQYDTGDADRGRRVFASRCASCHRLNGRGGGLGPDLSRITRRRTRDAIVRAIREPAASVAAGYRTVTLTTRSGDRIRGAIKSEDAFSIQIVDTGQRLQGYLKADLAAVVHEDGSLMPAFDADRVSAVELDDLLRYLSTPPAGAAGR